MQNAAALMDGFDMDIDSSGEKVSNAELAARPGGRLEDKKKPLQKKKPAAAPRLLRPRRRQRAGTASGQRGRSAIAGGAHE